MNSRKIVIINQAVNYLTIGICNEFSKQFEVTSLITGSIHVQGEELSETIKVTYIKKWKEEHGFFKFLNYINATIQIWWLLVTKYRSYEVFFISLPPMGYLLNLFLPHKFSMLIWDVYPDVFKITGMKESHILYRVWAFLNKRSFKKAHKIFTIGDKMADLLSTYISKDKLIIQPIWAIFQENKKISKQENPFIKKYQLENQFIVQYSGNIGLTHKVEVLLSLAERMGQHKDVLFQIIGRGHRKKYLQELVLEKKLENCQFLPFQSDDMFPYSLSAADVGVVILDEKTSKGSVPSKSYNLMSYGIPALYIAAKDSELNTYTHTYKHARCFTENKLEKAETFIVELKNNKAYYNELSSNNIKAAQDFKRDNAVKLVKSYIKE